MTGLTICFTEMRLTSAELRKENDMDVTDEGTALEIFMSSPAPPTLPKSKNLSACAETIQTRRGCQHMSFSKADESLIPIAWLQHGCTITAKTSGNRCYLKQQVLKYYCISNDNNNGGRFYQPAQS